MRITQSARKHGVCDDDIRQALRNPVRGPIRQADDKLLYVGVSHDSTPPQLVVVMDDDRDQRVIHAMRARPKYWP